MTPSNQFTITETVIDGFAIELIKFDIEDHQFMMVFTKLSEQYDITTLEELEQSLGFTIPEKSYNIKFDRLENFESGNFYAPPSSEFSQFNLKKLNYLGFIIYKLIELHANEKDAQLYFASAENSKLKSFYNRVVNKYANSLDCEVISDLPLDEGLDYAIKTSKY